MELAISENATDVAANAASRIADLINGSTGPRFTLGLAGGSTPEATYGRLLELDVEWPKVDVWLSDERWVPQDHLRCNGNMAAGLLMDHVDATFHRPLWGEGITPAASALDYDKRIRGIHPDDRPDLVLLGMGDDGHTASLFPGTAALDETERWIIDNDVPQQGELRITATYPLLWAAKRLIFLVVGDAKAQALKESLEGNTPAGRTARGKAVIEWHIDKTAASLIS